MSNTEKAMAKSERVEAWMKGKAPLIDKENYKVSLIKFLNWHNEFSDLKELRKIAVKRYPKLSKCTDEDLRQVGILLQCEDSLSDIDHMKLIRLVQTLELKEYQEEKPKIIPIKRAIDKVEIEASKVAEKIEVELDQYLLQQGAGEFNISVYLTNAKLTAPVARKIADYFSSIIAELEAVVEGKDEQLNEGYSHIPKPRIKRALKTILNPMMDNLDIIVRSKRAERKPRKKKEKSVGVLTKSVKYLKEFPELKLTSIDAKKIIGASQVWLYNTKYKKLTVLIADSGAGLTVKGTTVYGFDVKNSKTKVVRKPDAVLSEINKRKLTFHMKQMKTAEQPANGRINEDTIILTV